MLRVEKKFWNWFLKNPALLVLLGGTLAGILIRYWTVGFHSEDMDIFLRWYRDIGEKGGWRALSTQTGNYGVLFQTLMVIAYYLPLSPVVAMKAVLLPFDFVLAAAAGLIVKKISGSGLKGAVGYAAALNFPIVLLNGALWGQCESLITGFGLLAYWLILEKKPVLAFISLGIAFSVKLQGIFFLPFFLFLYADRKEYSLLHFLLIPATIVVTSLPGILQGRDIIDLFRTLINQGGQYERISYNYPSFWGLMFPNMKEGYYEDLKGMLIVLTLLVLAVGMLLLLKRKKPLTDLDHLKILALILYVCPLLLPNMHERYDYPAILACLAVGCLEVGTLPFLMVFLQINLTTYGDFLFGNNPNWVMLSVANIVCFSLYVWNLCRGIRKREALAGPDGN
ncbi:MAG: DUF2029 domain-containing protein [Clostridia bacterium]|nr:DUF2029 domain-containing protein [Clostridia bacterium]